MERNPQPPYSEEASAPSELPAQVNTAAELSAPYDPPVPKATHHGPLPHDYQQEYRHEQQPQPQQQQQEMEQPYDDAYSVGNKPPAMRPDSNEALMANRRGKSHQLSKKWQKRLWWIIPLAILGLVLAVLFEVYKSSFEKWVQPLATWLRDRESWSWTIPVAILFLLSFPPLFGHEIVQIVVGLTYPLGVALGIACAGSILGEAGCFIVFKYSFTSWVEKKIATQIKWAAIARVAREAGFRGVLVIRYSIVPPHLANPLFACTGMKFWLYMTTVVLSLPKALVFVALGSPGSAHSKKAQWAKVVAIGVVVTITIFASVWIRKKMAIATAEIEAERGSNGQSASIARDEEYEMVGLHDEGDTEYRGASGRYDPPRGK